MQNIHFKVEGQRIENTSDVVVVAKSKHEYKAVFSFSSEWEGLENKVAYFKTQKLKEPVFAELQDNGCEIPVEALETPYFTVSVAAGDLKTATICDVAVEETGYSDTAEPALSPKDRRRYADSLILNGKQLQLTEAGTPIGEIVTIPDFDKLELWNDITLSEDTQPIKISKTDDGKPFKIKKLFLYFYGKFNSEAVLCLRYNDGQIYQSWKMVSASTKTDGFWILSEKIAPGLYLSKYPENVIQVGDDGAAQGLGQHIQSIKADFHYDAKGLVGTSIIFGAHGSYTDFRMLTGSRILVWGVQDDD